MHAPMFQYCVELYYWLVFQCSITSENQLRCCLVMLFSRVLLLLVHVPLIVFLHCGLYVDLSVPLT